MRDSRCVFDAINEAINERFKKYDQVKETDVKEASRINDEITILLNVQTFMIEGRDEI